MASLIGPDVSHYQGVIDWNQVGGCCSFASSKATEGASYTDPTFLVNRQGMKAAGLKVRGLYHFGRPGKNPAVVEADHYCDTIGSLEHCEVAILDLEATLLDGPATGQWAREWMARAATRLNANPWLYSFGPFLAAMDTSGLQQYPLWLARYGKNDGTIPTTRPKSDRWPKITLWQYTSEGRHPGINGKCDLSVFEGSEDELSALVGSRSAEGSPLPSFKTWGKGVNIRKEPNTNCAVVAVLSGPTEVKIKCQIKGELVTAKQWSNDTWSFLPEHGGYVNNVYIADPAKVLPGVPICG